MTEILSIASQIAQGLDAVHSAGVIHRDIKPANVFITSKRETKILDFGMAKLAAEFNSSSGPAIPSHPVQWEHGMKTLTDFGTTPGTVAYMSPEGRPSERNWMREQICFPFGVIMYGKCRPGCSLSMGKHWRLFLTSY